MKATHETVGRLFVIVAAVRVDCEGPYCLDVFGELRVMGWCIMHK